MNYQIKKLLSAWFNYSGISQSVRRQNQNEVVILTYHGIIPENYIRQNGNNLYAYRNVVSLENFQKQLLFLKKHYDIILLEDLATGHAFSKHRNRNLAIITIDDGFENNYTFAFPVLKKLQVPVHVFLTTDFIGSVRMHWTEEINHRIFETNKYRLVLELGGSLQKFAINGVHQRQQVSIEIREFLKHRPRREVIQALDSLRKQTDDVDLSKISKERYQFLSWPQIKEMNSNGITFGSHTTDHFILTTLTDEELFDTLQTSKLEIEEKLGTPCLYFAYPNGNKEDFSEREFNFLRRLGYQFALTQVFGYNSRNFIQSNPYQLRRINIMYYMDIHIFESLVSGVWNKIRQLF